MLILNINAQGLKLIIIIIHLKTMKIYVATMEVLKKKER